MRFLIVGLGSIGRLHLRNLRALGEQDILLYRTHRATLPDDELDVCGERGIDELWKDRDHPQGDSHRDAQDQAEGENRKDGCEHGDSPLRGFLPGRAEEKAEKVLQRADDGEEESHGG